MDWSRHPILAVTLAFAAVALLASASPVRAQAPTGPTTPILDDFNRPNENPLSYGGRWTGDYSGLTGPLKLVSNQAAGQSSITTDSYWVAEKFAVDQEVSVTVTAKPAEAATRSS